MANRTITGAMSIHGSDPQRLIEKIIRERIYDNLYWKEECFGLNAANVIEKAVALNHIGGLYGNQRPTPFLCLLLKTLQLQPEKDIILEYIGNTKFKYLRALGAFYFRLTAPAKEVYLVLEPLLSDYRKLRERTSTGFTITHMDELVDMLLTQDRVFSVILPRLPKRLVLEETEDLPKRISPLESELNVDEDEDHDGDGESEMIKESNRDESIPTKNTPPLSQSQTLTNVSAEEREILEANALRAKLGLKPLQR